MMPAAYWLLSIVTGTMNGFGFAEPEKPDIIMRFHFCTPSGGWQMKHFLQTVQPMATNTACTQKAQTSLGSAGARQALSETLALSQKAIAQLHEARRIRPEQLNSPITL